MEKAINNPIEVNSRQEPLQNKHSRTLPVLAAPLSGSQAEQRNNDHFVNPLVSNPVTLAPHYLSPFFLNHSAETLLAAFPPGGVVSLRNKDGGAHQTRQLGQKLELGLIRISSTWPG